MLDFRKTMLLANFRMFKILKENYLEHEITLSKKLMLHLMLMVEQSKLLGRKFMKIRK